MVLLEFLVLPWVPVAQTVRNLPAMQETLDQEGSGRAPGEGNGYPLQYSCLENPMDRKAWQTTVHRVPKSHKQSDAQLTLTHFTGTDEIKAQEPLMPLCPSSTHPDPSFRTIRN